MDNFDGCDAVEHALVVVRERNAVLPSWVEGLEASPEALIINQNERESLVEFARRALHVVEGNERFRGKLTTLVLVAANDADGEAVEGRAAIARALIPQLSDMGRPRFLIVHEGPCTRDCQCSLLGLADVVVTSLGGSPIEVQLKFSGTPSAQL